MLCLCLGGQDVGASVEGARRVESGATRRLVEFAGARITNGAGKGISRLNQRGVGTRAGSLGDKAYAYLDTASWRNSHDW